MNENKASILRQSQKIAYISHKVLYDINLNATDLRIYVLIQEMYLIPGNDNDIFNYIKESTGIPIEDIKISFYYLRSKNYFIKD